MFKFLNKTKKEDIYYSTEEYVFYNENKKVIDKVGKLYPSYSDYGFNLICNNILIKAFLNKEFLENNLNEFVGLDLNGCFKKSAEMFENRPFILKENGEKVYFPQLSKTLNYIYTHKPLSLKKYPYDSLLEKPKLYCTDLFDTYGYNLFSSNFTSLIFIAKDKTSAAFYSSSFETIYIINNQGRLDLAIPIFDRKIKEKNIKNIEERIKRVVEKFYSNNRKEFVKALYNEKFISEKAYRKLSRQKKVSSIQKSKLERKRKQDENI